MWVNPNGEQEFLGSLSPNKPAIQLKKIKKPAKATAYAEGMKSEILLLAMQDEKVLKRK